MAFCSKCGTEIAEGVAFCPNCGTPTAAPAQPAAPEAPVEKAAPAENFAGKVAALNDTPDVTGTMDAADINANKGISVLSYIGPLVFVPLFARKNSPYAQYHAKQGFNLFVVDVAVWIVTTLLGLIKVTKTKEIWGIPYEVRTTPWFISLIGWVLSIIICVLAIIGIVNAAKGKAKELPIIGKFKFWKW